MKVSQGVKEFIRPVTKTLQCSAFETSSVTNFDVLLTVHLSIILVINQLNAQNLVLL